MTVHQLDGAVVMMQHARWGRCLVQPFWFLGLRGKTLFIRSAGRLLGSTLIA